MSGVRSHLVRIGNSQGIRIPKALLSKCPLAREVELDPQEGYLVVRPVRPSRKGWDEAFHAMAAAGDDRPLDELDVETEWERDEWRW